MKKLITLYIMLLVSGCATSTGSPKPAFEWLFPTTCPGTRYYDPQVCRGETWTQLPNQPFEAQVRRARGETW